MSKRPHVRNLFTLFNQQTKEIFQMRVNPVMTIGGLKKKIQEKYNLQDENDVIIQFNGIRFDSKKNDIIIKRKNKQGQRGDGGTNGGPSNKISRTPSPQAHKFRQTGTRTGTKGSTTV
jgi:hypothetical protein